MNPAGYFYLPFRSCRKNNRWFRFPLLPGLKPETWLQLLTFLPKGHLFPGVCASFLFLFLFDGESYAAEEILAAGKMLIKLMVEKAILQA